MKKIFFIFTVLMAASFFGCDGTEESTNSWIHIKSTDMVVGADTITDSATTKKAVEMKAISDEIIADDSYPQIKITASFFRDDGSIYTGQSPALDPKLRAVNLNALKNIDPTRYYTGFLSLICASYANGNFDHENESVNYYMITLDSLPKRYDITVSYYASASEVYTSSKTCFLTEKDYENKFHQAGFYLSTILSYDGYYNHTGATWGDIGCYSYTIEDEKKMGVYVDFEIDEAAVK